MIEHDFKYDLVESKKHTLFWEVFCQSVFEDYVGSTTHYNNRAAQDVGIDRRVFHRGGRKSYLDEKTRRNYYPDILLEYMSNNVTRAVGWIEKEQRITYLAYGFPYNLEAYLIPWIALQEAWYRNKKKWWHDYDHKNGRNHGYVTYSLAVPIEEILSKVKGCQIWKPEGLVRCNLIT